MKKKEQFGLKRIEVGVGSVCLCTFRNGLKLNYLNKIYNKHVEQKKSFESYVLTF